MDIDYQAIGRRIKEARTKKKLSQEKLAELSDLTPGMIGMLEKGRTEPSVKTLIALANILDTTTDIFLRDNLTHRRAVADSIVTERLISYSDDKVELLIELLETQTSLLEQHGKLPTKDNAQ